jgi:hypothetical protein
VVAPRNNRVSGGSAAAPDRPSHRFGRPAAATIGELVQLSDPDRNDLARAGECHQTAGAGGLAPELHHHP